MYEINFSGDNVLEGYHLTDQVNVMEILKMCGDIEKMIQWVDIIHTAQVSDALN